MAACNFIHSAQESNSNVIYTSIFLYLYTKILCFHFVDKKTTQTSYYLRNFTATQIYFSGDPNNWLSHLFTGSDSYYQPAGEDEDDKM